MSSTIDITHGGAIAVDPDALRAVARGMDAVAPQFATAAEAARRAWRRLGELSGAGRSVGMDALLTSADRADALEQECASAAANTLLMADVYELVELRTQLAGLEIQNGADAASLNARIAALEASDPRVSEMEQWLLAEWKEGRYAGLDGPSFDPTGLGGLGAFFAGAAFLGSRRYGMLRPGATLSGTAAPVTVTPVRTQTPPAPPASLADALRRIPSGGTGQITVEKYTMPDGSKRFMLYADGTRSVTYGGDEPFDSESNLQLYIGQESSSYLATVEALEAAGAAPGDRVDVVAYSQSAMTGAYLATQSEFDVQLQITAGSPVHPSLESDQLLVELRSTDDPVSALAGGGAPGGSGSPDSMVISRESDPGLSPLKPHALDTYIETAELAAESGDVRLDAVDDVWRELTDADTIEQTEYYAQRD